MHSSNVVNKFQKALEVPRSPTVREALLFHTGAPELVVQKFELCALDGRNCKTCTYVLSFHKMKFGTKKNPRIFVSKMKSSKPSSNKDLRVETLKQRKFIFMTTKKKERPPPNPKRP
jgi:hypothetical protein